MEEPFDIISLNRRAWNRVADRYDRRQDEKIGVLFDDFMEALNTKAKVLDIGSGTGLPYAKLLVGNEFKEVGIDFSSRMVELAKTNVPEAQFLEMSMTKMKFKNEFDGAISVFSLLHLDPPRFRKVARRIFHSLRKGGVLYLVLNEPKNKDADVNSAAIVEIMGEKMYSRGYTVEEVRDSFIPLGFEEIRFERWIKWTDEFGEEHVIEFIFRKI